MVKEDYEEYIVTKTYSIKIKNVKKVDNLALKLSMNKSKALNKMIEEFKE